MNSTPLLLFLVCILVTVSGEMVDVWTLPPSQTNNSPLLQFDSETLDIEEFSACFYHKPRFRFTMQYSILVSIPGGLEIGIYKDSENFIFDFPEPLFPRTWYTMCVQAGRGKRRVWHENQLIYDTDLGNLFKLKLQVGLFCRKESS